MRVRPLTRRAVVDELAERVAALPAPGPATRVIVDGAPPTHPGRWADDLVDPLRVRGRPVLRVSAEDFLRPASLRLERGRRDPDAHYGDRLDLGALVRELLGPAGPGGSGRVLPRWWDVAVDRSARARHVALAPGTVLLVDGSLLLGRGLPAELAVHLQLTAGALRRTTPQESAWTLPAHRRYEDEVAPGRTADVVVRVDHPERPALVEPG